MSPELWFDVDGTLFDFQRRVDEVHAAMMRELGVEPRGNAWALRSSGLTTRELMAAVGLPALTEAYVALHGQRFETDEALGLDELRPGALEMLDAVAPFGTLGILSGRDDPSALLRQLERSKLRHRFAFIETVPARWNSEHKAAVLRRRTAALAYVGDTPRDLEAATLARATGFALLGGMATDARVREVPAAFFATSWSELTPHLLTWLQSELSHTTRQ